MNSSTLRRLAADHSSLHTAGLPPNYLFPAASTPGDSSLIADDLTQLTVLLAGPQGTPYASGLWKLHLKIPSDYPRSPPKAAFRTRIWHPNVEENTGAVCVDTLKRDWESKLTLRDVLITISCLLINPNPDSALNAAAGQLLQDDYEAFARQAKLMASIHATVPKDMKESVAEAKGRGEDPNMAIREDVEEMQTVPKPKPRATVTSRVVMKRQPLPFFPARTNSGYSTGSMGTDNNDSSSSSMPIQHFHPHLVPSLPVHEDDDSSVASAYASENEDPEVSSKENNPSLSCSPVLAPTTIPRRLTVHTTSSSVLGKRALAELPIPVDPDAGSYYSDYYYYSSDDEDEYSEGEDLSPSERNIAANIQNIQQGGNTTSGVEQPARRLSSAAMSRTSSASATAMSRRHSAATSFVEEGPQRKSPRLTERGPGVNSSGRIRDDLESLFTGVGHVLGGSGSTGTSGFVTPFEDACDQEAMKPTASVSNDGKENVGDSTPATSQPRFVTGVVKKLPNGTVPTASGPTTSSTSTTASSLGRAAGGSLRKPAASSTGSWKGRPRVGLRRL